MAWSRPLGADMRTHAQTAAVSKSLGGRGTQTDKVGAQKIDAPIVELRRMRPNVPYAEWKALALSVFDYVAALNTSADAAPEYSTYRGERYAKDRLKMKDDVFADLDDSDSDEEQAPSKPAPLQTGNATWMSQEGDDKDDDDSAAFVGGLNQLQQKVTAADQDAKWDDE